MPKEFTGLKTHEPKNPPKTEVYKGSPCLKHSHSGAYGTSYSWRDSKSHACLECVDEIRNGGLELGLDHLAPQHQRIASRFWNRVSIESLDQCWRWTDPPVRRQLYFTWARPDLRNNYQFHPILVMNWLTYGDIGRMGTTSLCGNRRCCNPLHNPPIILQEDGIKHQYDLDSLESKLDLLNQQLRDIDIEDRERDLQKSINDARPLVNILRESAGSQRAMPDELMIAQYEEAYTKMLNQYAKQELNVRLTDPINLGT